MPLFAVAVLVGALAGAVPQGGQTEAMKQTMARLENELAAKYGESERTRIHVGIEQAAGFWRPEDGDEAAFAEVVGTYFASDSIARNTLFSRMEHSLESLDGHMNEIARDFRWQSDLDLGKIYPFDEVLAGYDPSAHFVDDSFQNRLAFAVLLNFPITTLQQRLDARSLLDAAPVGRGPPGRALLQARSRQRQPRDHRGRGRGRPLHRPVQHLDAPPRRREGHAPLPA